MLLRKPLSRLSQSACLVAAGFSASLSVAQDGKPLSEDIFFEALPVVLTVSRLAQPAREAPAMVTVIDRRMIEASGFTNIPDLLRLVPGFQVGYVHSWQPVVTYHGLSDGNARRLQVLVDGRSIFNPAFGQVDWRELPLAVEDIERIEVVHGPSAAAYGSNAFVATINIVTLQGLDEPGLHLAAGQGNHEQQRYLLRHAGRNGDLSHRVTLSERKERRFEVNPDGSHERFLNARFDYRLDHADELMAQFGLADAAWDVGSRSNAADPPHKSRNDNHFVQFAWHRQRSPDETYSLQYTRSHKDYRNAWIIPATATGLPWDVPVNQNYTVQREQIEFQANLGLSPAMRLAYGAELRHDKIQSNTYFAPGGTLSEEMYRLFGTWEWRPHAAWLVNLGGMAEQHYFAGTTVSPRFSLHFLPSARHAFRLGMSRGYRSETFYEQAPNYRVSYAGFLLDQFKTPAPDLKPEIIDSRELGYVGTYPELGLNLNLRLFNDHLQRLIEAVNLPFPAEVDADKEAAQDRNILDVRMWGAEYQLQWQPDSASRVIFNQAWIWQKARDHLIPRSNDENEMETSAPRLSYSLLASRDFGHGISASLGYYKVGQMSWLGEGDPIPPSRRLDLRLAKRWHSGLARYELALTLQNLIHGQQDFEEEADHTVSANRVFVSLRLWH